MAALTLFFAVFNFLEARLPALLTLAAPASDRGAALGVFATSQFLGAFCGGVGRRHPAGPLRYCGRLLGLCRPGLRLGAAGRPVGQPVRPQPVSG